MAENPTQVNAEAQTPEPVQPTQQAPQSAPTAPPEPSTYQAPISTTPVYNPLTGNQLRYNPILKEMVEVPKATLSDSKTTDATYFHKDTSKYYDYNVKMYPHLDWDRQRARNQGTGEQILGFAAQAGAEIVGGTMEAAGFLTNFTGMADFIQGKEFDMGNWLSDAGGSLKEGAQEFAPIYQEDPGEFAPGDFAWWAQNGVSVASALTMLIPSGAAVKGIGLGLKALGIASKGAKAMKALGASKAFMGFTKNVGKGVTRAVLSRQMENVMEASGVQKELYNKYKALMPEAEAKTLAAKGAADVYYKNWWMLATDIPQYLMMGGKLSMPGVASKIGKLSGKVPSFVKSTSRVSTAFASEGFEEFYQGVVGKEAEYMADRAAGIIPKEKGDTFMDKRLNEYLHDGELQSAAMWGGLGGLAFEYGGPLIDKGTKALANNKHTRGMVEGVKEWAIRNGIKKREMTDRMSRASMFSKLIMEADENGDDALSMKLRSQWNIDKAYLDLRDGRFDEHIATLEELEGMKEEDIALHNEQFPDNPLDPKFLAEIPKYKEAAKELQAAYEVSKKNFKSENDALADAYYGIKIGEVSKEITELETKALGLKGKVPMRGELSATGSLIYDDTLKAEGLKEQKRYIDFAVKAGTMDPKEAKKVIAGIDKQLKKVEEGIAGRGISDTRTEDEKKSDAPIIKAAKYQHNLKKTNALINETKRHREALMEQQELLNDEKQVAARQLDRDKEAIKGTLNDNELMAVMTELEAAYEEGVPKELIDLISEQQKVLAKLAKQPQDNSRDNSSTLAGNTHKQDVDLETLTLEQLTAVMFDDASSEQLVADATVEYDLRAAGKPVKVVQPASAGGSTTPSPVSRPVSGPPLINQGLPYSAKELYDALTFDQLAQLAKTDPVAASIFSGVPNPFVATPNDLDPVSKDVLNDTRLGLPEPAPRLLLPAPAPFLVPPKANEPKPPLLGITEYYLGSAEDRAARAALTTLNNDQALTDQAPKMPLIPYLQPGTKVLSYVPFIPQFSAYDVTPSAGVYYHRRGNPSSVNEAKLNEWLADPKREKVGMTFRMTLLPNTILENPRVVAPNLKAYLRGEIPFSALTDADIDAVPSIRVVPLDENGKPVKVGDTVLMGMINTQGKKPGERAAVRQIKKNMLKNLNGVNTTSVVSVGSGAINFKSGAKVDLEVIQPNHTLLVSSGGQIVDGLKDGVHSAVFKHRGNGGDSGYVYLSVEMNDGSFNLLNLDRPAIGREVATELYTIYEDLLMNSMSLKSPVSSPQFSGVTNAEALSFYVYQGESSLDSDYVLYMKGGKLFFGERGRVREVKPADMPNSKEAIINYIANLRHQVNKKGINKAITEMFAENKVTLMSKNYTQADTYNGYFQEEGHKITAPVSLYPGNKLVSFPRISLGKQSYVGEPVTLKKVNPMTYEEPLREINGQFTEGGSEFELLPINEVVIPYGRGEAAIALNADGQPYRVSTGKVLPKGGVPYKRAMEAFAVLQGEEMQQARNNVEAGNTVEGLTPAQAKAAEEQAILKEKELAEARERARQEAEAKQQALEEAQAAVDRATRIKEAAEAEADGISKEVEEAAIEKARKEQEEQEARDKAEAADKAKDATAQDNVPLGKVKARRLFNKRKNEIASEGAYELADMAEELLWLKTMLPNVKVTEIAGLLRIKGTSAMAFGAFKNGAIELSNLMRKGTAFHEAFHAVFNLYLTPDKQTELIEEVRAKYGTPTQEQLEQRKVTNERDWLEEKLADDFRIYQIRKGDVKKKGMIARFFDTLYRMVRDMFTDRTTTDKLFNDISTGYFADAIPKDGRIAAMSDKAMYDRIDTMTAAQQSSMTDLLVYATVEMGDALNLENITDIDQEFVSKDFYREILAGFYQDTIADINDADDAGNEELSRRLNTYAALYQTASNNLPTLMKDIEGKFASYNLRLSEERKDDSVEEVDAAEGGDDLNLRPAFEYSGKDNATGNVRLLLATLPTEKLDPITNLPTMSAFSANWALISKALADVTDTYNYNTKELIYAFDQMTANLANLAAKRPELSPVLEKLEDPNYPEEKKAQFFNAFSKTKLNFMTMRVEGKNGGFQFKAGKSESNSFEEGIRDEWNNNFNEMFTVLDEKEELVYDFDLIRKAQADYEKIGDYLNTNELLTGSKLAEVADKFLNALENLGITISPEMLNHYISTGKAETGHENLYNLYNYYTVPMSLGLAELERSGRPWVKNEQKLLTLANAESDFRDDFSDATVYGAGGMYYTYSLNNYLSKRIAELNGDPALITRLMEDSYGGNSEFGAAILGGKKITLTPFNNIRQEGSNKNDSGDGYTDMKLADELATRINSQLAGNYSMLTAADKSVWYSIKIKGMALKNANYRKSRVLEEGKEVTKESVSDDVLNTFQGYFFDEMARMRNVWQELHGENKLDEKDLIAHYHTGKQNGLKSFLFPELSPMENPEDGSPLADLHKELYLYMTSKQDKPVLPETSHALREYMNNTLVTRIKSEIAFAADLGIFSVNKNGVAINNALDVTEFSKRVGEKSKAIKEAGLSPQAQGAAQKAVNQEVIDEMIADFAINDMIGKIESTKLFHGDPAYYKSSGDLKKRVPGANAPGQDLMLLKDIGRTFNIAVVSDIEELTYYEKEDGTTVNTYDEYLKNLTELLSGSEVETKDWKGTVLTKASIGEKGVFVFGANPEGRHGGGAARAANTEFGLAYGQMANSDAYGVVTKDLMGYGNFDKSLLKKDDTGETYYEQTIGGKTAKFTATTIEWDGKTYLKVNDGTVKNGTVDRVEWVAKLPKDFIVDMAEVLYNGARSSKGAEKDFYVTYQAGSKRSLNGYTGDEMRDMLLSIEAPNNIIFHDSYYEKEVSTSERVKTPLKLAFGGNEQLVSNGKKTMTSRRSEQAGLAIGETALQEIDGKDFEVTYHGPMTKAQADALAKSQGKEGYEDAEAFSSTTSGKPTETLSETAVKQGEIAPTPNFIKGEGVRHIYTFAPSGTKAKPATPVAKADFSKHTNYSGAAEGSDSYWAQMAKKYGVGKQVDYTPATLNKLTPEQKQEVEAAYQQAVKDLGRKPLSADKYSGQLTRRDYLQARAADAVFAVGTIIEPGMKDSKGYTNKTKQDIVEGGTGYAVQMALNLGKPAYVFDQSTGTWFQMTKDGKAKSIAQPILAPKFAGVGTRGLKENGKRAIEEMFTDNLQEAPKAPSTKPKVTSTKPKVPLSKIKATLSQYKRVNVADGQAYITMQRFKDLMRMLGKWDKQKDAVWQQFQDGKGFNEIEGDMSFFFQPLKGMYFGKTPTGKGKSMPPSYLKYSQAVLVPAFVKGTPLDALRKKMEANDIQETVFESAIKVGARGITDSKAILAGNDFELNSMELDNRYWKLQQDLPSKYWKKEQALEGSQVKQHMLGNLVDSDMYGRRTGEQLRKDVNAYESALSDIGRDKMVKELGIEFDEFNDVSIVDYDLVYSKLLEEFPATDVNENIRTALSKRDRMSLEAIPQFRKKIQQKLLAMVNNYTVKLKMPGGAFVQMSPYGIAERALEASGGIIRIAKGKGLKPPRMENGKVLAGQMYIPFKMISHIAGVENMTPEQLRAVLSKDVLQAIGYRIPTQKFSSCDPIEIAGIIPKGMGDNIISYEEITAKTGSDYDIDKMYVMLKNFAVKYDWAGITEAYRKENPSAANKLTRLDGYPSKLQDALKHLEKRGREDFEGLSDLEAEQFDIYKKSKAANKPSHVLKVSPVSSKGDKQENLQNAKLEAYWDILTSPNKFAELISPVDAVWLENDAVAVRKLRESGEKARAEAARMADPTGDNFEDTESLRFFSNKEQMMTKIKFTGGKFGIGQTANQQVDHIKGQADGFMLYGNLVGGHKVRIEDRTFADLSQTYSLGGDVITETVSAFLNAYVDIAKDPYIFDLNNNTFTANTVFLLLRAGFDPKWVNRFISQASLVDLVQNTSISEGRVSVKSKVTPLEKTYNKYGVTNFEDRIPENFEKLPTIAQLEAQLVNPSPVFQKRILDLFQEYSTMGKALNNAVLSSKQDTEGAGKTLMEALINKNKLSSIMNERVDSKYRNFKDRFAEGRAMNAYKTNSLDLVGKTFNRFFFGGSSAVGEAVNALNANTVEKAEKVENAFYSYMVSGSSIADPARITELFYGTDSKDSMAKRIIQAKHSSNVNIKENLLVKSLVARVTESKEKDFVGMVNSRRKDVTAQNDLIRSWEELLKSDDPVAVKLGEDLANYAFLASGFVQGNNSFFDLIPSYYLIKKGFNTHIEKALMTANDGPSYNFEEQFMRNNWADQSFVKEIDASYTVSDMDEDSENGLKYFGVEKKDKYNMGAFVTRNGYLYQIEGTKTHPTDITKNLEVYRRTYKLGQDSTMPEYSYEDFVEDSRFEANNKEIYDGPINTVIEPTAEGTDPSDKEVFDQRIASTYSEDPKSAREKFSILQEAFPGVKMVYDEGLETTARVEISDTGNHTIIVNPLKWGQDTLIHEFGHIYIEALGGLDSAIVQEGLQQLEGTERAEIIRRHYKNRSEEIQQKEILADAIGNEGAQIFNTRRSRSDFRNWLSDVFRSIKELFGIKESVAKALAREMLTNTVRAEASHSFKTGTFDQVEDKSPLLLNLEEVKERLTEGVQKRLDALGGLSPKAPVATIKAHNDRKRKLTKLIEQLDTTENLRAMVKYTDSAKADLVVLRDNLKKYETGEMTSIEAVRDFHRYASMYSDIDYISDAIVKLRNSISKSGKEYKNILGAVKKLQMDIAVSNELRANIERVYLQLGREAAAELLAKNSARKLEEYRERYEAEFKRNTPPKTFNGDDEEWRDARMKYANRLIAENREAIYQEELDYMYNLVVTAPSDITAITASLVDPRGIDDDIIQITAKLLGKANYKAMQAFLKSYTAYYKAFEKFKEGRGNKLFTNMEELYGDMIEKDENGNPTKYLISKTKKALLEADLKLLREETKDMNDKEKYAATEDWWYENGIGQYDGEGYAIRTPGPKYDNTKAYNEFLKDENAAEFYKVILKMNKETNSMLPDSALKSVYELPAAHKSSMERLASQGVMANLKGRITDLKRQVDDPEFGGAAPEKTEEETTKELEDGMVEVFTNERREEQKFIPILFRGNVPIDEQSFDVFGLALSDRFMALNHMEKSAINGPIQVITDLMATRGVVERTSSGLIKVPKRSKFALESKGISSNSYKALQNLVDQSLYGVAEMDAGEFLGMNLNKVADVATKWTANTMLIANYSASFGGVLQGNTVAWIEAAGGKHYTMKNLKRAYRKYFSELSESNLAILKDMGREPNAVEAKINKLMLRYDLKGDFQGYINDMMNDSAFKRLFDTDSLHAFTAMGEHTLAGVIAYAMFDSIKVMDADGNYLTKDGTTDKVGEAMTLDEAYTVKDGELVMDERVKKTTEQQDVDSFGREEEFEIAYKIQEIIMRINGNYRKDNKAEMSRTIYGKLGELLRRWVVRGVLSRYRGVGTALKAKEDLQPHERYFNQGSKEFEEGHYTTAIRFISNLIRNAKDQKFKVFSKQWNGLSDSEARNMYRVAMGVSVTAISLAGALLLKGLADDEPKGSAQRQMLYYWAYTLRRLNSELMFFANPKEWLKTMDTPSVALKYVSSVLDTIWQLMSGPLETYDKGENEGQSKLFKKFAKVFPPLTAYSRFGRDFEKSYNFLLRDF